MKSDNNEIMSFAIVSVLRGKNQKKIFFRKATRGQVVKVHEIITELNRMCKNQYLLLIGEKND